MSGTRVHRTDSGVTEMESPPSGALVGIKWKPDEEDSPHSTHHSKEECNGQQAGLV